MRTREFIAYLNKEEDRDVDELRIIHLLKTVDITKDGVRFKVLGQDFFKSDIDGELPYVIMNGKKKSMANLWKEITGEVRNDI
jgi:hypothetical protein